MSNRNTFTPTPHGRAANKTLACITAKRSEKTGRTILFKWVPKTELEIHDTSEAPKAQLEAQSKVQPKSIDFTTRIQLVRAMELLARAVNDEAVFEEWLMYGVADGDIDGNTLDEELEFYVEDDTTFKELMGTFLRVMSLARKSGGLYFDNVTSI